MIFKIYDCDFGIKIGGESYEFEHVAELQIEDGVRNRLTRGANAKNKIGLAYKDGLKEPTVWTLPILAMSSALKEVLDDAFNNQTRVDVYCVARSDGSSKWARNAVMMNLPQQLTLDETAESMNVSLEFASFDSSENHKS